MHTNTQTHTHTKIKSLKNGYTSHDYPIYLNNNYLPTEIDKSNAFADLFAHNSTLEGLSNDNATNRSLIENSQPIANTQSLLPVLNEYCSPLSLKEIASHIQDLNHKKPKLAQLVFLTL